ncbi:MAG: hypothetical protein NZ772_10990 [Cyanobacteria bacterium]|nr:hypothetical protein [Cyanobacteriota bacterium]MDW8201953.1 hypothetical protein [Cyanobacteriota bacterium SKYGB_h_bin112]
MMKLLSLLSSVAVVILSNNAALSATLTSADMKLPSDTPGIPQLMTSTASTKTTLPTPAVEGDGLVLAQAVARLDFSWRSAPTETSILALQFIMNADSNALASYAALLMTGHDVYVVRVRLSNTGNMRLRIYPQNVVAYYQTRSGRQGSTRAVPITDSRFLQPDILMPNYYIDKPVVFVAPANLNVVRDFRLGYSDPSIQVRY